MSPARRTRISAASRAREHVPIGDVFLRAEPHRDHVAAGAQEPVERAGGDVELRPQIGLRDLADQRVDGRIGDAGDVARAGRRGRPAANTIRSASPGVIAPPSAIEAMSKSKSSMRRRYCAASTMRERASMPSRFRLAWKRLRMRLQRCLVVEELDLERLAVRQLEDGALALAAGLAQEARRRGAGGCGRCRSRRRPAARRARRRPRPAPCRGTARAGAALGAGRAHGLHVRVLEGV